MAIQRFHEVSMWFICHHHVILIFKTVRSGAFWQLQYSVGHVGSGQCNHGIFSRPWARVGFLSDQGMVHVGACGMLRCDFDTVGTEEKKVTRGCLSEHKYIIDPSILTDFTSPSTSSFHRQSQISRFSTRTLGSVCDLSGLLILNNANWH